eukprot:c8241_g1_i1.p1 GENE.c8241_g1_i1~~c8241_g1_i1.p1  ORF type:complete len:177 (+),score=32.64 c8241_g1_i1:39-569(+)
MERGDVDKTLRRCEFLLEAAFTVTASNPCLAAWYFSQMECIAAANHFQVAQEIRERCCAACTMPLDNGFTACVRVSHLAHNKKVKTRVKHSTQSTHSSTSECVRNILITLCKACHHKSTELGTRTHTIHKRKQLHIIATRGSAVAGTVFVCVPPAFLVQLLANISFLVHVWLFQVL